MSDKIYCGKGKPTKYGLRLSINLDKIPTEHIREFGGQRYVSLDIKESRQPDDRGNTHYAQVDTWRPDQAKQQPRQPKAEPQADAPWDGDMPF